MEPELLAWLRKVARQEEVSAPPGEPWWWGKLGDDVVLAVTLVLRAGQLDDRFVVDTKCVGLALIAMGYDSRHAFRVSSRVCAK